MIDENGAPEAIHPTKPDRVRVTFYLPHSLTQRGNTQMTVDLANVLVRDNRKVAFALLRDTLTKELEGMWEADS